MEEKRREKSKKKKVHKETKKRKRENRKAIIDEKQEVKKEEIKKVKKKKSKDKSKKKKKERQQDDQDEAKKEAEINEFDRSSPAKPQKKKKKKSSKSHNKPSPSPTVKSQASNDNTIENTSPGKQKSGRKGWTSKEKRKNGCRRSNQLIEVESIKVEEDFDWSIYNSSHNLRAQTAKKEFISLQDSDRIINLFTVDAGDYRALGKEMPHLGQRKIRRHLSLLFERSLQAITTKTLESGRKIKDWEPEEKRQILRELHRIRSSNRLLSEQNVELREAFHKLIRSHNHPEVEVTNEEINLLYRKIQAFVRGYNHFSLFRKQYGSYSQFEKEPLVEGARKPLSEGGYIMQSRVKRDLRRTTEQLDPERLVLTWREEEERALCELYLNKENNFQYMIENLRTKFGESPKWNDFQILGRKIDHLIKLGLDKLQRLTQISAQIFKPPESKDLYTQGNKNTEQKNEYENKLVREFQIDAQSEKKSPSCLEELSKMVYSNRGALRTREGGVIRQPSLLLRQIFANSESYEVKRKLTGLLLVKQPPESQLVETIAVIKKFTDWAASEEEKSHVRIIPRHAPILDERSWVGDASVFLDHLEGIQLKKQEWLDVEEWMKRPGHQEQDALQVLSSNESDYEGFIKK